MRILWSPQARDDLFRIFDHILADNPTAATAMLERIETSVTQLRDYPALGRPGTVDGTRELVVPRSPYIAAYETLDNRVHILAVRHAARLWPEAFS
ncbi:MAG: type II toxin-antitoxin system RelE/ParE family toxin [Alphaproteobacteria bacterium]|jgi:addiction module RelE/StbE family toxin|nr:type II toxin-antitoxin system RelE/ParE family toxin [Alphaproteobacteria bacterium]MDP6814169.1 type II toxin-antitoxin system RelE/ParE family toxin [Alphaproteobacteria bacterium]